MHRALILLLERTVMCTGQYLQAGLHGSCGPGAFVAAYQERFEGWATYGKGRALPPVAVLDYERSRGRRGHLRWHDPMK